MVHGRGLLAGAAGLPAGARRRLPRRLPGRAEPVPGAARRARLLPDPGVPAAGAVPAARRASSTGATPTASSPRGRDGSGARRPPPSWASPTGAAAGRHVVWLVLWVLYLSIVNVGQSWYSFGWESLLLEAGFLAVFLGNGSVAPPLPGADRSALAAVPAGVRRRADQAARRPLLARPDLPVLPPRDAADAGPAQLVLPPPAASRCTGWRSPPTTSPSSSCPFGLFLPQPIAGDLRRDHDRHPAVAGDQRQLRLAQLGDDRARRCRSSRTRSGGRVLPGRSRRSPRRRAAVVGARRVRPRRSWWSSSAASRCATCSPGGS